MKGKQQYLLQIGGWLPFTAMKPKMQEWQVKGVDAVWPLCGQQKALMLMIEPPHAVM